MDLQNCGPLAGEASGISVSARQTMNTASATMPDIASAPRPPMVRGLPLIGSTIEMAANPDKFFARCYRDYAQAFRVRVFGHDLTVIAGANAATFKGRIEGKGQRRSKEDGEQPVPEFGATK